MAGHAGNSPAPPRRRVGELNAFTGHVGDHKLLEQGFIAGGVHHHKRIGSPKQFVPATRIGGEDD